MRQYRFHALNTLLISLAVTAAIVAEAAGQKIPDAARVDELAAVLPELPCGVGRPIDDRAAWQAVADAPGFGEVVSRAEKLTAAPIPDLTDDLYLDFSRTGNRTRCQQVYFQRRKLVACLVLAECIENGGRFLPAIEEAIRAICSEKTWLLPAHDPRLDNFHGNIVQIDLFSAETSWQLATADYWLGEKLSEDLRKQVRSELERRTFGPLESYMKDGKPRMWWPKCTNNWNAVCLAGVIGSALEMIEDRRRRAFFVAAAEHYVESFLSGFTPDGYCSEGIGYWNYGFGHYVLLAETIGQATGGKVDLLDKPEVATIARFGRRMEIASGVYPAFADCSVASHPDLRLTAFLSRRFGWGLGDVEKRGLLLSAGPTLSLFQLGLYGFANSATEKPAVEGPAPQQPLRDWFADAGILICRPAPGSKRAFGVALKGGHNGEHHNHNDVGSFVVVLNGTIPLVDPGGEVYTRRTFSPQRYTSGVLNSFGHSVPKVAGKLQRTGRAAAAVVVKTELTDKADTLVLDIRPAYDVKELTRLQRTFVFSRQDAGRLTVTDEVEFSSPQSFGTALITFSPWRRDDAGRLVIGKGPDAVWVEIAVDGGDFRVEAEEIKEDVHCPGLPTRLGIDLSEPVAKASITLSIIPAAE